jgi:PleD family two-component response regulator
VTRLKEAGVKEENQSSLNILVIDDDERVRMLLRDILVFAGHRVIGLTEME